MTDALGNVTETHPGRLAGGSGDSRRLPEGRDEREARASQFDVLNRPVKTIYADGNFETTTYDTLGRRISSTDAEGKTTRYEYDLLGRMTAVIDALDQRTEYTFDELGRQLTQKDALGRITRYEYDLMGRRTKRTLPGGQFETYHYDTAGRLASRTDFNGHTTTYTYHSQNDWLMTKTADETHPSLVLPHAPKFVSYGYDILGRRTSTQVQSRLGDVLHQQTWSYDNRDRLSTTATPLGTLAYTYDDNSRLLSTTSSTVNGYAMSYEHDDLNRLTAAVDHRVVDTLNQPTRTTYAYTAVGALETVTLPNTLKHFYQYNARHQLTACGIANAANATVLGYSYTLNKLGQRTQTAEYTGPTNTRTVNYLYDSLHRLTQERVTGLQPVDQGQVDYTLDAVGNRNARTSTLAGVTNQTQTVDANDRLTTDSTDANGNTTASNGKLDIYDFENRLIRRIEVATNKTIDLLYDADGNRVAKSLTTQNSQLTTLSTHCLLDTNNPTGYAQVIEEHTSTNASLFALSPTPTLSAVYACGLDLISQDCLNSELGTANWELRYFLYDGGGHVRALANELTAITDTYTFDAYGLLIASTGTTANNYLYRGEQFDHDLGMYYQRARYLNAETGRFWTQDTYEGSPGTPASLHKYFYANGDPVGGWDPSGYSAMDNLVNMIGKPWVKRLAGAVGAATAAKIFFGLQVQAQLTVAYKSTFPTHRVYFNNWLSTILPGAKNEVPKFWTRGRPDIADATLREVYEIKAFGLGDGLIAAIGQLSDYLHELNTAIDILSEKNLPLDSADHYSPGNSWEPPSRLTLIPIVTVKVWKQQPGVIMWDSRSIEFIGAAAATLILDSPKLVNAYNAMRLRSSMALAGLTIGMGFAF